MPSPLSQVATAFIRYLLVFLSLALIGCQEPPSPRREKVAKRELESPTEAFARCMSVVSDADRIELELVNEAARIGPIVITDKSVLESLRSEMARLTSIGVNPHPFSDALSGSSARITFIRTNNYKSVRVRLCGSRLLVFPETEQFQAGPPDDSFWNKLDKIADAHGDTYPADVIFR